MVINKELVRCKLELDKSNINKHTYADTGGGQEEGNNKDNRPRGKNEVGFPYLLKRIERHTTYRTLYGLSTIHHTLHHKDLEEEDHKDDQP